VTPRTMTAEQEARIRQYAPSATDSERALLKELDAERKVSAALAEALTIKESFVNYEAQR
jgi:hypothetical protein